MIMEKNMDPTIVFAFSKKECESLAMQVGKLDFNDDAEKDLVEQVDAPNECGMSFENYDDIKDGDVIECFEAEEVARTL